jgi:hypothetical protein
MTSKFYAWACKTGLTPTAVTEVDYTIGAYSQSVTFTGSVTDFTDPGNQKLATADAMGSAYVSWDATNLYVGFDQTGATSNPIVHFYVGGTQGGTATADAHSVVDGRALPANFHAQFHVFGSDAMNGGGIDVPNAQGNWVAKGGVNVAYHHVLGTTFYELSVPLAALGLTPVTAVTTINLLGGAYYGNNVSYGSFPSGNTDTGAWAHYQTEMLGLAFAPNDTANLH